jgi:Cu-Zn family superoxide dismutase
MTGPGEIKMGRWIFMMAAVLAMVGGCKSMSLVKSSAVATLVPTTGNKVAGTVNFSQHGEKMLVEADVTGLSPGLHGFHIHEKGDCRAGDGSSAGGHFNPAGTPHGGPASAPRHAGDLGNLVADAGGHAVLSVELTGITLGADPSSIIGRSVIVHAGADDLSTQPSGGSGARQACGLIGKNPDKIF